MKKTKTIAADTIVHPAWCDPEACGEDTTDGHLHTVYHWNTAEVRKFGNVTASVSISRVDDYGRTRTNGPSTPYLQLSSDGASSLTQLSEIGSWLVACSADMGKTIATEGGAR